MRQRSVSKATNWKEPLHVDKRKLFPEPVEIGRFLVIDPRVCHGKMTFRGTRIPVETVLHCLSEGRTVKEILVGWPYLKQEAVEEAIRLAAVAWPELLREEVEEAIWRLAVALTKRKSKAKVVHESDRTGRTA